MTAWEARKRRRLLQQTISRFRIRRLPNLHKIT